MNRLLIVPVCLLLVACGRDATESEAETTVLRGELHYLERIVMPPDSWLEIELIDEDSEQLLAMERIDDTRTPPFAYELSLDTETWLAASEPLIYFTLYLPDGSPRFAGEYRPQMGVEQVPAVRLTAVDVSEDAPEVIDEPEWLAWRCGEVPVDVLIDGEQLHLALPWQDVRLEPVRSASGARYGDGQHEFWSRGDREATLTLNEQPAVECQRTEQLSPWTRARQNGVWFRATGNEPGWLMEVSDREQAELRLELDYGSRELLFEALEVLADRSGFVAESAGNHAEISLAEEDCQDTMSGWVFPLRVEMTLNDLTLTACGREL